VNLVAQLKEIEDFDVLSTDFTEIRYARGQAKAHLMPIIDRKSKLVLGHAVGESADTELGLEAWKRTRFQLRRMGKKVKEVIIHHDQDGVFIGHEWLHQVAIKDKVRFPILRMEQRAMSPNGIVYWVIERRKPLVVLGARKS
jgi:hypothetical protein